MKKSLLSLSLLLGIAGSAMAQNDCGLGRYLTEQFPTVKITKGVQFGEAKQLIDITGTTPVLMNQKLYMDIYEPDGDIEEGRPLIVMAFGGAFVAGSRDADYMIDLCTRYAKLGYVTASIDYRLTRELATAGLGVDKAVAPRAVLKGAHDMKAAIRYFRKDAGEGNAYRIDPDQIYAAGLSAGAFCAIHTAYLDKESELPEVLKPYAADNGGIEGLSGNPGYSSEVSGVISFAGAIGDTAWIEAGDVPIVSTHGTNDGVVPYGSDSVTILGINYPVDGSSVIHKKMNKLGISNAFHTYYSAGHAMEGSSTAYRDTGFAFTRDFMYTLVCDNLTTGVGKSPKTKAISVFPNPAGEELSVLGAELNSNLELYSMTGQLMLKEKVITAKHTMNVSGLVGGIYMLKVLGNKGAMNKQVYIY